MVAQGVPQPLHIGPLAAQVQEKAFDYLDAPVARLAAPFAPVPYAPVLENAYVPDAARIEAAARRLLERR